MLATLEPIKCDEKQLVSSLCFITNATCNAYNEEAAAATAAAAAAAVATAAAKERKRAIDLRILAVNPNYVFES
jgi:hypothetical protein